MSARRRNRDWHLTVPCGWLVGLAAAAFLVVLAILAVRAVTR